MKALSIRQPWAWLIANGHKDIENRSWYTHFRGRFLIHAAKGMTRDEYDDCHDFCFAEISKQIVLPDFSELQRGGIVGTAKIVRCAIGTFDSEWFAGPFGFVIQDAVPVQFFPCRGALGFFEAPVELCWNCFEPPTLRANP